MPANNTDGFRLLFSLHVIKMFAVYTRSVKCALCRPTFPMVALTAHEANPGHHYQVNPVLYLLLLNGTENHIASMFLIYKVTHTQSLKYCVYNLSLMYIS